MSIAYDPTIQKQWESVSVKFKEEEVIDASFAVAKRKFSLVRALPTELSNKPTRIWSLSRLVKNP